MSEAEIRQALRSLMHESEECKMRDDVADDDGLREVGVMDSFDMITFVVRIEECFSIQMAPADLDEDNFRSIASIARLVHSKDAA